MLGKLQARNACIVTRLLPLSEKAPRMTMLDTRARLFDAAERVIRSAGSHEDITVRRIVALEFGIEISDDVIETITTIGDAERFVMETLHDKG